MPFPRARRIPPLPMPAPSLAPTLTLLSVLLVLASPAVAQEGATAAEGVDVRGVAVDALTGTPLAGAVVRLSPGDRATLTDDAGRFAFGDVAEGVVMLNFDQLGYAVLTLTRELTSDDGPIRAELAPMPVVMEGFHVMADRLEARRQAVGVAVRVLDAEDFRSLPGDLFRAVRVRGGIGLVACRSRREVSTWCTIRRGSLVQPAVYIDDRPAMGGLEELGLYTTDEVHAVEVYRAGSQVRVYTRNYMKRLALAPRSLPRLGY